MTTTELRRLVTDLSEEGRLVAADAYEEAGRTLEAKLLRATRLGVFVRAGDLIGLTLTPQGYDRNASYHEPDAEGGWINCVPVGGCWVDRWGDLTAYTGNEQTGGATLAEALGLDLAEGEEADLEAFVNEESLRVCRDVDLAEGGDED